MNNKNLIITLFLSLLLFLLTCAYVPNWFYLILIGTSIYFNIEFIKSVLFGFYKFKIIDLTFTLLLVFAFLMMILRIFDINSWNGLKDFYSYAYLFPFTYLGARTLKIYEKGVLKWLIIFIAFESLVAILQYFLGVSSFFTNLKLYREFTSYDMLYYTRVFGFSSNSSMLSLKLFIGLILLNTKVVNKSWTLVFEFLFLALSILAFGRIILIVIPIYYLIKICINLIKYKRIKTEILLPFLAFILFFSVNPSWTNKQFTRNNMSVSKIKEVEDVNHDGKITDKNENNFNNSELTDIVGISDINMSGRNKIWNHYFNNIESNIFFGNYGKKYLINDKTHAHNSYLQILSSFGIIFTIFLLAVFILRINYENFYIVIPIFLVSLGQYFVFWGISFFDVIFYYFLFFTGRELNEK